MPVLAVFISLCLCVSFAPLARGHNGPPFPIIVDQRVGPCIVSLWTHPDVGVGTFFVMVDAAPGIGIPSDLKIDLGIQPVSGRLAEVIYPTRRENLRGQLEYKTEVNFDRQEFWRARVILHSSQGDGESTANVEATPVGFGRWDLLLYVLPFAGVGFLWFKMVTAKRNYRRKQVETGKPLLAVCVLAILCGATSMLSSGCGGNKLPRKSSKEYVGFVSIFYTGLAALQVGDDVRAESKLGQATQMAAGEPAGWADWGILALRQRNFDVAAQRLRTARDLAPKNDHIYYLLGLLESNRGRSAEAIAYWRKSVELNPQNLRATYQLAEEIERQGDAGGADEFQRLVQRILAVQPNNLAALLELSRIAAKRGDATRLRATVERIEKQSAGWAPEGKQQLQALQAAVAGQDTRPAATRTAFLRNVLMRDSTYRQSLSVIKAATGEEAEPFTHFLRLETPVFAPAAADTALTFETKPLEIAALDKSAKERWDWIGSVSLSSEAPPTVIVANGREVRVGTGAKLTFPGGTSNESPLPESILPIDFNYDFRTDLVVAGTGGVRFWRQESPEKFTDVTAQTKLTGAIVNASYLGAWAVDIEADGDLDVVMGSKEGAPLVLRNNGDGTFTMIHPFANVDGVRGFAWADLNGDSNPDAAIIDGAGRLRVFLNDRAGQFHEQTLAANLPHIKTVAVADANKNGVLALLAVQEDGKIIRLADKLAGSEKSDGSDWDSTVLAQVPDTASNLAGEVRLRVADLDNNGAFDLWLARTSAQAGTNAGALVWLADQNGKFALMAKSMGPSRVFDAADLDCKGRMDLLGLSADGQAARGVNRGTRNYHWQTIRPRARQATGDQRINPFGVGGEMEIRSGLLVQKQPITGPQLHFGLGEQSGVDVARIVWPNGSVRAEFDLKADQQVVTEQRLKGSCPFLFAFDGHGMRFVKDAVPWSSALGLRVNNTGAARIAATEEWYKIGADELVPHDGFYDLRITAELWETYYYDYLALMTVDHPAGMDIFVDERFVVPPSKLAITAVETPHKIARAMDDQGRNVTDIVATLDGKYLDTFSRGQYQGVTRDHFVEVELGDDAPAAGPLYLVAQGWTHPSDSSINVAITQGDHEHARGLSLEVLDSRGHWVVARNNLGFPAGRKKICLIELSNLFHAGQPRKLRLRTNLEIYWDCIEWARGVSGASIKTMRLAPDYADLHYRGYSVIHQAEESSPEIPDYAHLEASKQKWRDLSGYYTRFGDVRELLAKVDDRYIIMNAGDEMTFRFAEQAPPQAGWKRDFVIVGDGWIKDGDYNTTFSKTVIPLPYHAKQEYLTPPGRLEDEWVYQQHPEDWQNYHTRYVTPSIFQNALRSETQP
jgi:tetratricopeptide (TPR) repeat protein